MKSTFKVFLLIVAASLSLIAVAGEKTGNGHSNGHGNGPQKYPFYQLSIFGEGGTMDSEYIEVDQICNELPDLSNLGGTVVFGNIRIYIQLANNYVEVVESYEGLDACPDSNNSLSSGSNQSVTISVGGYVVTADCTGQIMKRGREKNQNKYPVQKRWETYSRKFQGNSTDSSDGSCEVTAIDPVGNTEMFYTGARASITNGYTSYN